MLALSVRPRGCWSWYAVLDAALAKASAYNYNSCPATIKRKVHNTLARMFLKTSLYTGWPRVQSNILVSCSSAAAARISTKFELGKTHMLTFCGLNFQVIRLNVSQLIHVKLNHKKSVHAGFQQFSLVGINSELLN